MPDFPYRSYVTTNTAGSMYWTQEGQKPPTHYTQEVAKYQEDIRSLNARLAEMSTVNAKQDTTIKTQREEITALKKRIKELEEILKDETTFNLLEEGV